MWGVWLGRRGEGLDSGQLTIRHPLGTRYDGQRTLHRFKESLIPRHRRLQAFEVYEPCTTLNAMHSMSSCIANAFPYKKPRPFPPFTNGADIAAEMWN